MYWETMGQSMIMQLAKIVSHKSFVNNLSTSCLQQVIYKVMLNKYMLLIEHEKHFLEAFN